MKKPKPLLAKMFFVMHKSVFEYFKKILAELCIHYYFTPTNYLQVVSGYNKYTRAHVVSLWLDFMLHAVVM